MPTLTRRTLPVASVLLVLAAAPAGAAAATTDARITPRGEPRPDGERHTVFAYTGSFSGALGRGSLKVSLRYPNGGTRATVTFAMRRSGGGKLTMRGPVRFTGLAISGSAKATRASGGYSRKLVGRTWRIKGTASSSATGTSSISLSR